MCYLANSFKTSRDLNFIWEQLAKNFLQTEIFVAKSDKVLLERNAVRLGIVFEARISLQTFRHDQNFVFVVVLDGSAMRHFASDQNVVPVFFLELTYFFNRQSHKCGGFLLHKFSFVNHLRLRQFNHYLSF